MRGLPAARRTRSGRDWTGAGAGAGLRTVGRRSTPCGWHVEHGRENRPRAPFDQRPDGHAATGRRVQLDQREQPAAPCALVCARALRRLKRRVQRELRCHVEDSLTRRPARAQVQGERVVPAIDEETGARLLDESARPLPVRAQMRAERRALHEQSRDRHGAALVNELHAMQSEVGHPQRNDDLFEQLLGDTNLEYHAHALVPQPAEHVRQHACLREVARPVAARGEYVLLRVASEDDARPAQHAHARYSPLSRALDR